MCGIIGAVAKQNVRDVLLNGLKLMEYRGYDSAGVALLNNDKLIVAKACGRIAELEKSIDRNNFSGNIGIAHTRWATHGAPTENNCHPIFKDNVAIVHNGIIENYKEIKKDLEKKGYKFVTDTDTESVAYLLHSLLQDNNEPLAAIAQLKNILKGSYAIAILLSDHPQALYALRCGSPLVIGLGAHENFIASDQLAMLPKTNDFIFLEDGDSACITIQQVKIYDRDGSVVKRKVKESYIKYNTENALGEYRHYMQKEIFEQPSVIKANLSIYRENKKFAKHFIVDQELLSKVEGIQIVACGTSYHAGLIAKEWCETYLNIPCFVEIASEFRAREQVTIKNMLFVAISQSGETADTLQALQMARKNNYLGYVAICNIQGSSLTRESDFVLLTHAGVEIGVASTKAFIAQLFSLLLLINYLAEAKNKTERSQQFLQEIQEIDNLDVILDATLQLDNEIRKISRKFIKKDHTLFLGRGVMRYVALEGALKLKEISYIHAEAYAGGELKHGPLALVDDNMPVIALVSDDHNTSKMLANLEEVKARGGNICVFTDVELDFDDEFIVIKLPKVTQLLKPFIYTIPLQLFSYHVSILRGTDVDKPRNLAKSVTVE